MNDATVAGCTDGPAGRGLDSNRSECMSQPYGYGGLTWHATEGRAFEGGRRTRCS